MYYKYILPLILFVCSFPLSADTIYVEKVGLIGPYTAQSPFKTEQQNLKRESFKESSYLDLNATLIKSEVVNDTLHKGDALFAENEQPTLRVLRFTLRTNRFTPATLNIRNLKSYKVFVDEKEGSTSLKLMPGQTQIDVLCLTTKDDKDSLSIAVTGENLSDVAINATGKRAFTQSDILFGEKYGSATLSPTGKYMSYSIYTTDVNGSSNYITYLKEASAPYRLIRQYSGYVRMDWLEGRDVLYTTRKDNNSRNIYEVDPTNGAEKLLAANIPDGNFTLSPTGDYLIVFKEDKGPEDLPGTKRIIDPDDRIPGWRNRQSLYKYDIHTHQMQRLTFGEKSVYLHDISNDGKKLLLSYSTFKPERVPFDSQTYFLMDIHTGKVDTLLRDTIFVSSGSFSPDATQIVFKASPQAFNGICNEVKKGQIPNGFDYRLYLYDIATHTTTPLLPNFAPSVGTSQWAVGDNNIYFKATDGCNESLFRVNPRTKEVTKYDLPLSYIQQFCISYASKHPSVIFYGQSGDRSRDLYIAELSKATPKAKQIGEQSFENWSKDLNLPTSHDWSFRATRGDTINGFYFLPQDFDATKKYPMIVYYYGGCTPTSKILEGFWPLAATANMGYVVLVLNPSGAIGYGQEFAARHVGTWGDESGDDIIEGVKCFSNEQAFVDKSKIGCMGASYGGFMTQYLMTKTDIFACAISHAGISDITGYWGGGYWGYTYGETAEYGSFPWSRPDIFVEHSPLYNADKIHTPLLLLHGTADTNVPTNQSQAMYTALRILNRPVAYVTFEGENHVITDFKKKQAWQQIINAWFAKWLQGDSTWWKSLYPGDCFDDTKK